MNFSSVVSTCVQSQNVSSQVGTWFDMFCKWWDIQLRHACALASHVGLVTTFLWRRWTTQFSASRHGRSGGRKRQSGNGIGDIVVHSRILVDNPSRSCLLYKFCFLHFTLVMQGTLRLWMLALLWARLRSLHQGPLQPGAAGRVVISGMPSLEQQCCILASL